MTFDQEAYDRAVVEFVKTHGSVTLLELMLIREAVSSMKLDQGETHGLD